jgi:hypothetical protein
VTDTGQPPAAGATLSSPHAGSAAPHSRATAAGTPAALLAALLTPLTAPLDPGVGTAAGVGQTRSADAAVPAGPTPRLDAGRRIPHGVRRRFHFGPRPEVTARVGR